MAEPRATSRMMLPPPPDRDPAPSEVFSAEELVCIAARRVEVDVVRDAAGPWLERRRFATIRPGDGVVGSPLPRLPCPPCAPTAGEDLASGVHEISAVFFDAEPH